MISVTVVVPTYNRAQDLERCLKALQSQSIDAGMFEVIVVDDGSGDSTATMLSRFAAAWPSLRCFRQVNSGPAAARNVGITHANGSVVAFTDDDCIPPSDWVQLIHDRFATGFAGCLHGAVHSSLPASVFVHSVVSDGPVITSNIAIPQTVFKRVGTFDTRFRAPWCEDADLYWRMKKAGVEIVYDADLIMDHPPRYLAFRSFLRKTRFFQYAALIARKHPDMEPLSGYRSRMILAAKKLIFIPVTGVLLARITPVPLPLALLIAPLMYCAVDFIRLRKMKVVLAGDGFTVPLEDQVGFVLLNWTVPIAEMFFLMNGVIRFRSVENCEEP